MKHRILRLTVAAVIVFGGLFATSTIAQARPVQEPHKIVTNPVHEPH